MLKTNVIIPQIVTHEHFGVLRQFRYLGMTNTLAGDRWKILKKAIFSSKRQNTVSLQEVDISVASVRNFRGFGLFTITDLPAVKLAVDVPTSPGQWQLYSCDLGDAIPTVVKASVKLLESRVSLEAMVGFNNTGNICIWPAEEVLAYHCLEHRQLFQGANVCELGCGMTGLAGLMLACTHMPSHVLLTDGNEVSITNVRDIVEVNKQCFGDTNVSCDVVKWESASLKEDYFGKYDYVISADCLFFEDLHHELISVIKNLLKPNEGTALIFAPRRGKTLEQFCTVAEEFFQVEKNLYYSGKVWKVHQEKPYGYKAELHYPLYVVLKKRLDITLDS